MDIAAQWLLNSLEDVLPDSILDLLHQQLQPSSPTSTLLRTISSALQRLLVTLLPLLDRLVRALHASPDLVVLAVALGVLLVAIQILSWARRLVLFWTRLAFRVALLAAVAALLAAMWQRGFETTARDCVVVGGKVVGYAALAKDVWVREYRRYEAQGRAGPEFARPPPGGRAGARAGARTGARMGGGGRSRGR